MAPYRLAVLGDPVEHSRSPELHRTMLSLTGLKGEYTRIKADGRVLAETVNGLRQGLWDGLNITMPLKVEAARLADTLSPRASQSGSVNTLMRLDGSVHGDSTDSVAFEEMFTSHRFSDIKSILILGSGGAAAAAMAAIPPAANVYVASRRGERAVLLSERMGGEPIAWGAAVAGALVVNATPLGMSGETLPSGVLDVAAGLIDLPYSSDVTPAAATAAHRGIPVADGHELLLRQAIASFALWTGVSVEFEALTDALRKA